MNPVKAQQSVVQPWEVRADWAAGEIKSADRKNLLFAWGIAIFWNLIAMPVGVLVPKKIHETGNWILYVALIFPLVGIFLIIGAVRGTIRLQKFGSSVFKMLSVPGKVGGSLSGVIETKTKVYPEGNFRISLSCIEKVTTGSGKNRRTEERVLWEEKKIVNQMQHNQVRSGIPVFFEIPSHCSATSTYQRISWKLQADAEVAGIDFHTEFEVPVFVTSAPGAEAIPAAEFAARYETPIDVANELSLLGIKMETTAEGVAFSFPAGRNKKMGMMSLFFFLLAVAGLVFALSQASIFGALVAGAFTLVLGVICVELWFKSFRVIADTTGLTVHTTYLKKARTVHIPAEQIDVIEVAFGAQAGNTVYYDIRAFAPRRIELGSGIKGRKEADWIVDKMYSALNVSRKS